VIITTEDILLIFKVFCRFLVNRRIYVAGFGIYGSVHGPAEYAATIEVSGFNEFDIHPLFIL